MLDASKIQLRNTSLRDGFELSAEIHMRISRYVSNVELNQGRDGLIEGVHSQMVRSILYEIYGDLKERLIQVNHQTSYDIHQITPTTYKETLDRINARFRDLIGMFPEEMK